MGNSVARRHGVLVGSVLVMAGMAVVGPGHATAAGSRPGRAAPDELVYVANADGGPVTAYLGTSQGAVRPALKVDNPNLNNTFWDPWTVAFDASKHLYAQTFLSDATTFVFPPNGRGHVRPTKVFMADGPDTRSIAVDSHGFEYVASGQASAVISVVSPRAAGRPADLYHVQALRTIQTDETLWWPWADILTTDSHGDLMAAIVRSRFNAVEVFKGGPTGPDRALRVISGPHTGLGSCGWSVCNQMSMTFSPLTNEIFVAVSSGSGIVGHISVFAANASGDAAPLRTIAGTHTGLAGNVITGLAVSQQTGQIYAMVKTADFGGHGTIEVFDPGATGDAAPVRAFTDGGSAFAYGLGIAVIDP